MEKDVTRHIEEQLSAFLDGELPEEELALLVRRLERDEGYRATLDRYALIGGAMRNDPVVGDVTSLRRSILEALDDGGEVAREVPPAAAQGQVRYLLAASLVVGMMAVFFAGGFDNSLNPELAPATPPALSAVSTTNLQPVVDSNVADNPVRSRHQQELRRIKLNQERMRSYLISHGEYSRPMQGALADSSMYVQQASFSE